MSPVAPIFLLSLPRSGSTLVQRVLGGHADIATRSEPWLMLPQLLPLHPDMPLIGGWQRLITVGIRDLSSSLPNGVEDYLSAVRTFALEVYRRASDDGQRYFLDKTPAYHWIADDLFRTFPDGRFIYLWRNPLAVVASHVQTFCDGKWGVHQHTSDLFDGVTNLVSSFERNRDRAVGVRFEDLITGSHDAWRPLFAHLALEFEPELLERFSGVDLTGRLGDVRGRAEYRSLSSEPVDKWKATITTPVRKAWCRRYLRWHGADRLAVMGYDLGRLERELEAVETSFDDAGRDATAIVGSVGREVLRTGLARIRNGGGAIAPSSWRRLLA